MADENQLRRLLQRMLEEIDADDDRESRTALETRLKALEDRQFTLADLRTALESASDDELTELRSHLTGEAREVVRREEERREEETPPPEPVPNLEPAPPGKKTRPGRKKGMAYRWWPDEKGHPQAIDVPRVYQGDDEPDFVELEDEAEGAAA